MFCLPIELSLHILSYLPPGDVLRFHRLNSYFKRLTIEHPSVFKNLSIAIVFREQKSNMNILTIDISTPSHKFVCIVKCIAIAPYVEPYGTQMAICGNDEKTSSLHYILTRHGNNMHQFFAHLLTKGNFSLELNRIMPIIARRHLNSALREAKPRIEKVIVSDDSLILSQPFYPKRSETLKACYAKGAPEVVLMIVRSTFFPSDIEWFNIIFQQHPKFCMDTTFGCICFAFYIIVTNWLDNPECICNFPLRLRWKGLCDRMSGCYLNKIAEKNVYFDIPSEFRRKHWVVNLPEEITFGGPVNNLKFHFKKENEEYVVCKMATFD